MSSYKVRTSQVRALCATAADTTENTASDDFEVSIFLTETTSRHSLLYKHKIFRDKTQTKLVSNSSRMTGGASRDAPIDVEDRDLQVELPAQEGEEAAAAGKINDDDNDNDDASNSVPGLLYEDSDEDEPGLLLDSIPAIDETGAAALETQEEPEMRRSKRRRHEPKAVVIDASDESDRGEERATSSAGEEEGDEGGTDGPPAKKRRDQGETSRTTDGDAGGSGKTKKLAMDISYEGFAIYGRVLCLVVKRREASGSRGGSSGPIGNARAQRTTATSSSGDAGGGAQAMMESWIASTQVQDGASRPGRRSRRRMNLKDERAEGLPGPPLFRDIAHGRLLHVQAGLQ